MKKIIAVSSLALLLAACNNETPVEQEPQQPEVVEEEPTKEEPTKEDVVEEESVNETEQPVSNDGVEDKERALITETVENFATAYSESVNTGTIQPLMNGIIMHGTDYNGKVEQEVMALHEQQVTEKVLGTEVSLVKKNGDTDYEAQTIEKVERTQNEQTQTITYERTYNLFYEYVEDDPQAVSFFKVVNVETKIIE